MNVESALAIEDLSVWFRTRKRGEFVKAVNGVSLDIAAGETLGLIGESGSGKSTLGRSLLGLAPMKDGTISVRGRSARSEGRRAAKSSLSAIQMVFQDPTASLDPRMTIEQSLVEPLAVQRRGDRGDRARRASEALERVGLSDRFLNRFPHQLSGGQKQRVNIARALMLEPKVLVCDESVSALDVSMQAEILNLLRRLQAELGISYLFITHDLSVVSYISHRVAVMYLGRLMELGRTDDVVERPLHPYTEALISAQPSLTPEGRRDRIILSGEVPSPVSPPTGCVFSTRCPYAREICTTEAPRWRSARPDHWVACHFAEELALTGAGHSTENRTNHEEKK